MDFLNKAFAQLADLFRSMTPGARLTAGLLLIVVVTSLGYLFRYETSGTDTYLFGGESISPSLLPAMQAAFNKAHLESFEIVGGSQIRVAHGQQAAYMGALADAKALPPNFGSSLRSAIDNTNPFETKQAREERIRVAIDDNLALWIRSMPGIENADVMMDTETKPGFGREQVKTASVVVKASGGEPIKESQVESIRYLVQATIAGLKPECVTVTDLAGHVYHGSLEEGAFGGENTYMANKTRYEEDYKRKILAALSFIPNLTVETNVQLDKEKFMQSTKTEVSKGILLTRKEKTNTQTREGGGGSGGRAGYQANATTNGAQSLGGAAQKGSRDEEEGSQEEETNVPSTEQVVKESVGLTPEQVKVTVGIPNDYFEKVWRERNPVAAGQEAKPPDQALEQIRTEESLKIQKHVAALLPPAKNVPDLAQLVTITSFQSIKPADIPLPGGGQKVVYWLADHWSTLGLIGLGLVSLMVLRSMVRSVPGGQEVATMQTRVAADTAAQEKESIETVAARRLQRFSAGGPSLRDELSELVKEDPDAAANILRSWIGHTN